MMKFFFFFLFLFICQACQLNYECPKGLCWNYTCYDLNQTNPIQKPSFDKQKQCLREFMAYNLLFYERTCPIFNILSTDYGLIIEHKPCVDSFQNITFKQYKQVNHGYIEYMESGKAACVFNSYPTV